MAKWADKLIVAVRFNRAGTHIDRIRYHKGLDGAISDEAYEMERITVVAELKAQITFATITTSDHINWHYGAKVGVFPVNGTDYIKTKADSRTADNLDNLPTF